MKKITVSLPQGTEYDILIEKGILNSCGKYIKDAVDSQRAAVITDSNVAELYLKKTISSLNEAGFETVSYVFKAGEASKNTVNLIKIVEFLAANELTRKDVVVALGGGVTGDMASFAAAIYLRGIRCVEIPTTLLSQVDSSVGGKTAVNLPQGKNLCGAFHQPSLVLVDIETLKTLPQHYFRDGMGEVIKYGCIKSRQLFEKIEENNIRDIIEDVIYECIDIKRKVVERDEKESGERRLLNFGHTAGHSIEKLNNFSGISHGEAVGIGMLLITRASEKNGLTEEGTAVRIEKVLKKYGLKTSDSHPIEEIIKNMNNDKKRISDSISFILIKSIGDSYIKNIKLSDIPDFFN